MLKNLGSVTAGLICAVGTLSATEAYAVNLSIRVTADNAYGIYTGTNSSAETFVGGEQNFLAGDIFMDEVITTQVDDTDTIYVATWNFGGPQGLLIEMENLITGTQILGGDANWEVAATGIDLSSGSPFPTLTELTNQIALANNQTNPSNGWQPVFSSPTNIDGGIQPFGYLGNFSDDTRWMWHDSDNTNGSPFAGLNEDEYLIFRLKASNLAASVPEPSLFLGAIASFAMGTLLKRRQRATTDSDKELVRDQTQQS